MRRLLSRRLTVSLIIIGALLAPATAHADGDIDGDGDDDLVVGVPSEGQSGIQQAGVINVLKGTPGGIRAKGDRLFSQKTLGGNLEELDRFGNAVAYGDFNGDGYDDVAVGSPGEDWAGRENSGVVHIMFGSPTGLSENNVQLLSQVGKMAGANESGDFFGAVLAAGNINNDKYDDIVIGVPGEDIRGKIAAGAIIVAFGGPSGIKTGNSQFISQRGKVPDWPEEFDAFGSSLSIGDFNNDGFDDVVIGTPGEDVGSVVDAGTFTVLYGRKSGLNRNGDVFQQGSFDDVEAGDQFGYALAAGDFNGDGFDDVAASAQGEDVAGVEDAGSVTILAGSAAGVSTAGAQTITQDLIDGAENEAGDQMGSALAAGNFNAGSHDDLLIGLPFEDVGVQVDAGRVLAISGSATGLDLSIASSISQKDLPSTGPETGDRTGDGMRVGDFNGDGHDDVAIGSPLEDLKGRVDQGVIHVVYGSDSGLDPPNGKMFQQNTKGVNGKAEAQDRFGSGL